MLSQCRSLQLLQIRPHLSPYSGKIAIDSRKEEWESQLCPVYSCSPHISCSFCHPLKPTSDRHNNSTQTPEVNSTQTTEEINSAISCELCLILCFFPIWQWCCLAIVTPVNQNELLVVGFFSLCHLFEHKMLYNSAEIRISLSPSMKVDETIIKGSLCIHASVQGCGLGIPSRPRFLWFCFLRKQKC